MSNVIVVELPPEYIMDLINKIRYADLTPGQMMYVANAFHNEFLTHYDDNEEQGMCWCMAFGFRLGNSSGEKMIRDNPWMNDIDADAEATQMIQKMAQGHRRTYHP